MVKIPIAEPYFDKAELQYVSEAVKSGWVSSAGKYIPQFEKQFAKYCGVKYRVATSNGTTALHLALKALGIKKDDEVIVQTVTFTVTANMVAYLEAIEIRPFFYPIHTMPPYRKLATDSYPVSQEIAKKGIKLPSAVTLKRQTSHISFQQ
jgi:dTDP-4-amino-4,6-dideoxygalactose transaminase